MNARFFITALLTSALNLALHTLVFVAALKDFFAAHPAGSAEFLTQLNKDFDQLVVWALVLSALSLGFLITLVTRGSGARTFASGLRFGVVLGGLYWAGINFGLYASSNMFSLPSVLADLVGSAGCMALSAGFAAWMLGRERTRALHPTARSGGAHNGSTSSRSSPIWRESEVRSCSGATALSRSSPARHAARLAAPPRSRS